ncbi:MAG: hypothetical protein ACOCXQ_03005 [Patescibacteria group bacterium]
MTETAETTELDLKPPLDIVSDPVVGDSDVADGAGPIEWDTIDSKGKALTGRTPERIHRETGISSEVMFPDNKQILYIGDPWQRMGKEIDTEQMTIIDYEYGEVASFEKDRSSFFRTISNRVKMLEGEIQYFLDTNAGTSDQDRDWLLRLYSLVKKAAHLDTNPETIPLEQYPTIAKEWEDVKSIKRNAKKMRPPEKLEIQQIISPI